MRGQVTNQKATGGLSSIVKSVQYGQVASGGLTNTATINEVVVANSIVQYLGLSTDSSTSTEWDDCAAYLELTNSTTITRTVADNDNAAFLVNFCVIEYEEGVLTSNQTGLITMATDDLTKTATITEVNTDKAMLIFLGNTNNEVSDDVAVAEETMPKITLTNSTTITASRDLVGLGSPVVVCSYQIVEFL